MSAARVLGKATGEDQPLLADVEAAWAKWSKGIKGVDERGGTLLRAAFEAGAEAASRNSAAMLGRAGGKKGGKARAEKLPAKKRSQIARKAAKARWNQKNGD